MTFGNLERIFFAYIVLVGLMAGGVIVQWPQAGDYWLKPYFWMLLAVAGFDAAYFAIKRVSPAEAMPVQTRVIGFIGGTLLMAAVVQLTGSPAKLF